MKAILHIQPIDIEITIPGQGTDFNLDQFLKENVDLINATTIKALQHFAKNGIQIVVSGSVEFDPRNN